MCKFFSGHPVDILNLFNLYWLPFSKTRLACSLGSALRRGFPNTGQESCINCSSGICHKGTNSFMWTVRKFNVFGLEEVMTLGAVLLLGVFIGCPIPKDKYYWSINGSGFTVYNYLKSNLNHLFLNLFLIARKVDLLIATSFEFLDSFCYSSSNLLKKSLSHWTPGLLQKHQVRYFYVTMVF